MAKADSLELAPEVVQVIAVVAEIMLEQRRRQLVEGKSVAGMITNDAARNESLEIVQRQRDAATH